MENVNVHMYKIYFKPPYCFCTFEHCTERKRETCPRYRMVHPLTPTITLEARSVTQYFLANQIIYCLLRHSSLTVEPNRNVKVCMLPPLSIRTTKMELWSRRKSSRIVRSFPQFLNNYLAICKRPAGNVATEKRNITIFITVFKK